eukprot:678803-Prymnesium_polylepis.1
MSRRGRERSGLLGRVESSRRGRLSTPLHARAPRTQQQHTAVALVAQRLRLVLKDEAATLGDGAEALHGRLGRRVLVPRLGEQQHAVRRPQQRRGRLRKGAPRGRLVEDVRCEHNVKGGGEVGVRQGAPHELLAGGAAARWE